MTRLLTTPVNFSLTFLFLVTSLMSGSTNAISDPNPVKLNIAVASNFHHTLSLLLKDFPNPDNNELTLISGASGILYAQIKHGAPFDLFLSADTHRPQLLEQDQLTKSRQTYAIGKLALWSASLNMDTQTNSNSANKQQLHSLLINYSGKLAYANPQIAPFGVAAKQTLTQLSLMQKFEQNKVLGNNINQVFQFVDSGNVTWGLVTESSLIHAQHALGHDKYFHYYLVPSDLHQNIEQQLVVLKRTKHLTQVNKVVEYLLSKNVQQRLSRLGYVAPVQP